VIVERVIISKAAAENIFANKNFLVANCSCKVKENPLVLMKRDIGEAEIIVYEFLVNR